jgi:hypothetical protein
MNMKNKLLTLISFVFILAIITGCASKPSVPTDAAFKITGMVDNLVGWTNDELRGMDTIDVETTNKAGETVNNTGVKLNTLLDSAKVQSGAATIVFVGDDGYTAEASWEEIKACADCIVAFGDEGGFNMVLPGFPGNVQVKGVVEIQVK